MNLILEEILLEKDKEFVNHQAHFQLYKDKLSLAVCIKFG